MDNRAQAYLYASNEDSHLASDEMDRLRMMESIGQDIRDPAMNVLNMGAIVLRESTDPSLKEYVTDMRASGQQLLLLSNDILDMNKIRTNSLEISVKEYDLFAVLCDCYTAAQNRKKSSEFELLVDSSIPTHLEGDEARLWQIISNILFNADRLVVNGANIVQIGYRWIEDEENAVRAQKINLIIDIPDAGVSWTGASLTLVKMLVAALGGEIKNSLIADGLPVVEITIPQKVVKNELMGDFKARCNEFIQASENKSIHFYAPNASILAIDDVPMNLRVMNGLMCHRNICRCRTSLRAISCDSVVTSSLVSMIYLSDILRNFLSCIVTPCDRIHIMSYGKFQSHSLSIHINAINFWNNSYCHTYGDCVFQRNASIGSHAHHRVVVRIAP